MDKLSKDKKTLEEQLKEYNRLEKFFGEKLKYSEEKDQSFVTENIKLKKKYLTYNDFMKWVGGKSKNELKNQLCEIDDKLNKKVKSKIEPSEEQKNIIECVSNNKNVVVDAVAGSGKTTTLIFIGKKNPEKKILQITYNKALKFEVREKIELENLTNLEIHTYHSLTVKFYDKNAHTDEAITKVLTNNKPPTHKKQYDILVIDEVQDMTPNYYKLIHKFIHDMKLTSTLLILGDRYQGVYEFKNADTRFLIHSNKIWEKENVVLPLQQSYRVTEQIAYFVNNVMLGQNRITSTKKSKFNVQYFKWNIFSIYQKFANKIADFIKLGYKPSDVFVLSPSVKSNGSNNPIKKLEHELVEKGIPVYFSRNEEDGIDDDIIKGKVVFTTFHQAKGRERKIVFVFGFDDTYFDYHCKDKDRNICPSELYVAVTRASEILIVLESASENSLSFLKYDQEKLFKSNMIDYYGGSTGKKPPKKKKESNEQKEESHSTTVSELTKYISEENTNRLIPLIAQLYKIIKEPQTKKTVDIPSNVKMSSGLTEDVSDLNGLVIPAMYENNIKNQSSLEIFINYMYATSDDNTKKFIDKRRENFNIHLSKNPISAFLFTGNMYIALNENIYSKLTQIDKYDWLTEKMIKQCHKNLSENLSENTLYEQELGNFEGDFGGGKYHVHKTNMYGTIYIKGRADAIDGDTLWELKCVNSIQFENLLQVIVYAWLHQKTTSKAGMKYKILNIRTGEVRELMYENYIIEEIMSILFENKYYKKDKDSDEQFILKCKNMRESIKNGVKIEDNDNMFIKNLSTKPTKKIIQSDSHSDGNGSDDSNDSHVGNMFMTYEKPEKIKKSNKKNK